MTPFQIDHMNLTKPTAKEITLLRRALQQHFCIKDAAAAKKLCADISAVTTNLWRRWEQNASQASEQAWLLTRIRVNELLTEGSDFSTQMKLYIRAIQRSSSARPRPNALLEGIQPAYDSVDFA